MKFKFDNYSLFNGRRGQFTIYITVYLKDGTEEYTKYFLRLDKPQGDLVPNPK